MAETEKAGRKFLYYDIGGAVLIAISVYFFFQTVQLAGAHNYMAGIGLVKVSAAAKVTK